MKKITRELQQTTVQVFPNDAMGKTCFSTGSVNTGLKVIVIRRIQIFEMEKLTPLV